MRNACSATRGWAWGGCSRAIQEAAACASQISRFEPEWLTQPKNLASTIIAELGKVRQVIAKIECRASSTLAPHRHQPGTADRACRGVLQPARNREAREQRQQRAPLSCRTFAANAVRLQLHALAYNLGNFMRTRQCPRRWHLVADHAARGRYVVARIVPAHYRGKCQGIRLRRSPAVTAEPKR